MVIVRGRDKVLQFGVGRSGAFPKSARQAQLPQCSYAQGYPVILGPR